MGSSRVHGCALAPGLLPVRATGYGPVTGRGTLRWTPGDISSDIEDRRGESGGGGFGFGGYGPHLGIGGTLVLLVLSLLFGRNFFALFSGGGQTATYRAPAEADRERQAPDRQEQFVSFVLEDVQNTWDKLLPAQTGVSYRHAKLDLYSGSVESACGMAQSAIGPFYCPGDERVYLDMSFFNELRTRFGAPGEFAEAYVIAHELGHHVQKILGIESKVNRLRRAEPSEANPLSVRLELQADCLAGVWANASAQRGVVEQADIPKGLAAAAAVGDDRLQRESTGHVSPDSFTHGTSAQRVHWFEQGMQQGRVSGCDTFSSSRE